MPNSKELKIAVVMPAYKSKEYIMEVISRIGNEVHRIYVIDDGCPQKTGEYVQNNCKDTRVIIICHVNNYGVGKAVKTGYENALKDGHDIIVKIDSDGQMDPNLINEFVYPISTGVADYVKGNRFYDIESLKKMPKTRLIGNAFLSFISKMSSGYWDIFDPTNGYTAVHRDALSLIKLGKVSDGYFFESDVLFRLNIIRAVVVDIPMVAIYGNEISNLKISNIFIEFIVKNFVNFNKRILYNYYVRDMSLGSIQLPVGLILIIFGIIFGFYNWVYSVDHNIITSAGTVMLAALPILLGTQFILAFIGEDISNVPRNSIHRKT
jgi:dolichol-phosphate mannosyltransferase